LSAQESQFAAIDAVIATAIANDWAEAGATMPVLNPSLLRDTCHANADGQDVLGRAILAWWQ
jgi:lysophospholipase L1-like esterase